jgi:hypothetical protein
MKISIWDILTVGLLLAVFGVSLGLGLVFLNPDSMLNPFPPPTLPPLVVIPSATATLRSLPPTWTTVPTETQEINSSSTPIPSQTLVKFTETYTPTITRTATITSTATKKVTPTPLQTTTPTLTRTNTAAPSR